MVLVWDEAGRLCLQQRGESDSRGRWDVSVSGHRDFGESDVKAALRETGEELGLTLDATQLEPFGEPLQFIKEGSPAETRDHHVGPYHYRYCTEKKNCERTSVFLARISEDDKGELAVGPGRDVAAVDWVSLDSLAPAVEAAPGQYASAVKQLLHPEIVERLRRQIESRGGGFAVT
jgi:8-oxo-dGTP pyrophosphatase MutT (NUDIX family)